MMQLPCDERTQTQTQTFSHEILTFIQILSGEFVIHTVLKSTYFPCVKCRLSVNVNFLSFRKRKSAKHFNSEISQKVNFFFTFLAVFHFLQLVKISAYFVSRKTITQTVCSTQKITNINKVHACQQCLLFRGINKTSRLNIPKPKPRGKWRTLSHA